eukprot:7926469-Heterocapsa_arctica.AAC.1
MAEAAAEWTNPSIRFNTKIYTDGSAIHPEDPWLRRAAWGIAWRGPTGNWQWANGRTPGRQTVAA